jgi:predicted nuclease of predicted toxin-antitoxin system
VKLLLDAMYPQSIAAQLRRRGHDVVAVTEDEDVKLLSDAALLAWATDQGRAVVTENTPDFLHLDHVYRTLDKQHQGIVLVTNERFGRATRQYIGPLVRALDAFLREDVQRAPGWIYWLTE